MEGDEYDNKSYYENTNFNPRPRVEGDPLVSVIVFSVLNFNPRPRVEGDPFSVISEYFILISILALVWRATCCLSVRKTTTKISILALVWRATNLHLLYLMLFYISILALVWRATRGIFIFPFLRFEFQSSPSCGGRRCFRYWLLSAFVISILALVWRATKVAVDCVERLHISILALVWRATFILPPKSMGVLFQSSPSCGGRLQAFLSSPRGFLFQSSPSCGGRLYFRVVFLYFL